MNATRLSFLSLWAIAGLTLAACNLNAVRGAGDLVSPSPLSLPHCAGAAYVDGRLFIYTRALPEQPTVFLARYRGVDFSGGGDNVLFRVFEPCATVQVPLALDQETRFYSVTGGAPPAVSLWRGRAEDGGRLWAERRRTGWNCARSRTAYPDLRRGRAGNITRHVAL